MQRRTTRKKKWLYILSAMLIFISFASCSPTVYAAPRTEPQKEENEDEDQTLAPYFIIFNEDATVDCFPLKATEVTTNISGVIAETYVTQTYTNEGDTPISARYVFPVSTDVTVHGMKMQIGNQVVTAQIKEKEEAKKEYEEAKSEGKSASLLEQKRPNVFTMDVANIMPGDTALIELHYTEMITPVEGIYQFVFPTVVGPRFSPVAESGDTASEKKDSAESDSADMDSAIPGSGSSVSGNSASDNTASDSSVSGNSASGNAVSSSSASGNAVSDSSTSDSSASENSASGNTTSENSASSRLDSDNSASKNSVSGSSASGDQWVASPYLADGETPPGEYKITVNLSTGVPITELSCKSHEINVSKENDSTACITLADPEDYAGNRDFILNYKLTGEEIQSGLVVTSGEDENYFMLTVQPPERYEPEDIPPREYIFVLDVSGSMSGYPLKTAKSLIRNLVTDLREIDTFNLILFSGTSDQMAEKSLPATSQNVKKALAMIDDQEGGGGTSLAPALENALAIPKEDDAARSIVIITDGYISNEKNVFDIINDNMSTASFFSFGIGKAVNDYLIEGIATAGSGESFVVTDSSDASDCAENFRTYIQAPLLTDIAITYDGFQVYDVEPSVPATLFAQKPIVLFGKWSGNPAGTITITGKTGNEDYTQEIPIENITVETDNDSIRYLWARTRLQRITDYGSSRNDPSRKEEVTQIGLTYSMATPYTSFVAVIDTVRNPEGKSTNVDQASPLPLEVSNLAVGGGYVAYSEPGDILLILVMAGVVCLGILCRARSAKCKKNP